MYHLIFYFYHIYMYTNKILNDTFNYLKKKPTICLAKNIIAPMICKKLFLNSTIFFLVSGINHIASFYPNYSYECLMKLNNIKTLQDEINCINCSDKIIFNSNQTMSFYNKFYSIYKHKFINKIIDTSIIYKDLSKKTNTFLKKKYDVVICCSNLQRPDKNNLILIPILKNLIFNKYTKIIIGNNNSKFKCIPNAVFFEQLSNNEIINIFIQSRVLLYPSLCEANSNTIKEALNNSCHPLLSKNCGFSEIYPEYCVCNSYNENEWEKKLINLLKNNYICDKTIYNIYDNNLINYI